VAVPIAHPHEVKAIAPAKIKADRRDSEVLALTGEELVPRVIVDVQQVSLAAAASACTHGDGLIGTMSAAEESGEYE
jgi:hypothetical protein